MTSLEYLGGAFAPPPQNMGAFGATDPTTGLQKTLAGGYANQKLIYDPNTKQQGYMVGNQFYPISGFNNQPALPPAVNYTPNSQLQNQLAQAQSGNGLLSLPNFAPTRVAPKLTAKPHTTNPAALTAQYLK